MSPESHLKDIAHSIGAVAVGVSLAAPVDDAARQVYLRWLAEGRHGSMTYLERYLDIRFDPRLLLDGARSIISLAFPYRQADGAHHQHIADYALGRDYHIVLRERIAPLVRWLEEEYGAASRTCVDSAPILERYWARRAGLGFIGLNRQLIVPGVGSGVFLAEVVTTAELAADNPMNVTCDECGLCVEACPGRALDNGFDSCRCRSYLTVEHRGELPDGAVLGQCVAGCDICQRVCPHNQSPTVGALDEFMPRPEVMSLDREALCNLTSGQWRRLTRDSALSRIPLSQLRRNLTHLSPE